VGLPVAILGDRGSRKVVTSVTLLIFAAVPPLMAISPNVWFFVFFYLIAAVAFGTSDTVMNLPVRRVPDRGPSPGLRVAQRWSDPLAQTIGPGAMTFVAAVTGNWRWSLLLGLIAIPIGFWVLRLREPSRARTNPTAS